MHTIKIRQSWKNNDTGNISYSYYTLDQLKQGIGGVDNHTLLADDMWTGLKDKNGVKIYEGDILGIMRPSNTWQVSFYPPKAAYVAWADRIGNHFVLTEAFFRRSKVEVVGNIYENPERLE